VWKIKNYFFNLEYLSDFRFGLLRGSPSSSISRLLMQIRKFLQSVIAISQPVIAKSQPVNVNSEPVNPNLKKGHHYVNLHVNTFNILQDTNNMSSSPSFCGICDIRQISKPSEVWCPDCEEGLCTECIEYHSLVKLSPLYNLYACSRCKSCSTDIHVLYRIN
jgi:hypothetical protein